MNNDPTKEVDDCLGTLKVDDVDSCSFFAPNTSNSFWINICAFCIHGQFEDESRHGVCKFRKSPKKEESR